MKKVLGEHLIIELYNCDPKILNNKDEIETILKKAAVESGSTVVGSVSHKFSPQGVSVATLIAESHLAIHTWPEHRYAAVDIFTCGDEADPSEAYRYIKNALKAEGWYVREMQRGLHSIRSGRLYLKL